MNNFSLEKKRILIIGASKGIGLQIAIKLNSLGSQILGIARSNIKPDFEYCEVDISDVDDVKNFANYLNKNKIQFDGIVVNSAVSEEPNQFENMQNSNKDSKFPQSPEKFRYINDINLISVYDFLFNISIFIASKASIVFISSIGAEIGFPSNPGYQTSKAGLNALVRAIAIDLAKFEIRVNYLNLGYIKAPMSEKSYQNISMRDERTKRTILGRWGDIEEVIGPVIFLLSKESSYITGSGINVDGGWLSKGL